MRLFFTVKELYESTAIHSYFHEFGYYQTSTSKFDDNFKALKDKFSKINSSSRIQVNKLSILEGMDLYFFDFELNEPLNLLKSDFSYSTSFLLTPEIRLNISNGTESKHDNIPSIFYTMPCNLSPKEKYGERVKLLLLNFDKMILKEYFNLAILEKISPTLYQDLFHNQDSVFYFSSYEEHFFKQFMSSIELMPYTNTHQSAFILVKVLELIYHLLEQFNSKNSILPDKVTFKEYDYVRIQKAKEILLLDIESPPSVLELSKMVGLNSFKLQTGFKEVFGTTIFNYLYNYRMERAKYLLTAKKQNITETSLEVGYSSMSKFSTAFRKKYGVNPSYFKNLQ